MSKTKKELEELVADLEHNVSHLQRELDSSREEVRALKSLKDGFARMIDTEKKEHRETHEKLRERDIELRNLKLELAEAKRQIAILLTQNVRLQGRVEGLLIAIGKLQLVDRG